MTAYIKMSMVVTDNAEGFRLDLRQLVRFIRYSMRTWVLASIFMLKPA